MGKKNNQDKNTDKKTNVMRVLDGAGISYNKYSYSSDNAISGTEVAKAIGINDAGRVFKTLVTVGKTGEHYVFVVPVNCELDLKKAAKAVGEKSIEMIRQKELLPLTGYIHGGCSPIGMKKPFRTVIHFTAEEYDSIVFSAGKIGYQVEVTPSDLKKILNFTFFDIVS